MWRGKSESGVIMNTSLSTNCQISSSNKTFELNLIIRNLFIFYCTTEHALGMKFIMTVDVYPYAFIKLK